MFFHRWGEILWRLDSIDSVAWRVRTGNASARCIEIRVESNINARFIAPGNVETARAQHVTTLTTDSKKRETPPKGLFVCNEQIGDFYALARNSKAHV